jgi:nucleotide-binding universal stress UspA family protein
VAWAEEAGDRGTRSEEAIKEFFFGSVTNSVLEASTVPLFLFH